MPKKKEKLQEPKKPYDTFILKVKIKGESFFKIPMSCKVRDILVNYAENKDNNVASYEILKMNGQTGEITLDK